MEYSIPLDIYSASSRRELVIFCAISFSFTICDSNALMSGRVLIALDSDSKSSLDVKSNCLKSVSQKVSIPLNVSFCTYI